MDYSPPRSSVHGILQARILEWVAISFSRGSSLPRDQTWVSCIAGSFFTSWATREGSKVLRRLSSVTQHWTHTGFPCGSAGKESARNAGDLVSIPGLGRSPGEGKGYPLWYSGLENSMDRGAWQATVHGVSKSWTLTFTLSEHIWALFTRTVRDLTERCCWHFRCWCSWKMDAPTSTFREVPPASIFCFTSSFFKVQWLLGIGCAIICPCADYREGLEGSAWAFGVELGSASLPLIMWEIPQIVKWDSNYHQEESVVTVNYHSFVVQYQEIQAPTVSRFHYFRIVLPWRDSGTAPLNLKL